MDRSQFLSRLKAEKQAFLDDLRPKYILPTLLKYKVLTKEEEKDILKPKTPQDQVESLFFILSKKSPHVFPHFIKALHVDLDGCKTYPWLAEKLEIHNELSSKANKILVNGNVPFSVNHLIDRPEKLSNIRNELKQVAETKSRHWVVLFGPIGSGKTVLASESLRDNNLTEKHFPGGIYWINAGDSKEKEVLWMKMKRLLKMIGFEGDLDPKESVAELTRHLMKEVSERPKMLLVLDDVWYKTTIKAFDIGCPILVTTKDKTALENVSSYCSHIKCLDDLKPEEVLELLKKYVGCDTLPKIAESVSILCKESPLITCLIGGKMSNTGSSEKAWEALYKSLIGNDDGLRTVRRRYSSGDNNKDLPTIVNLCLEPIEQYKDYYLDFLIFVKDIPVSDKVLEILWDKPDFDVQDMMFELYNRCFIKLESSEEDRRENNYSYTSHDLYLDTLKADIINLKEEKTKRHKKLAKKVLQLCCKQEGMIDLTRLPKGYLLYTIGYHLYHAEEYEMLRKLYLNLYFIEQKIHLTNDARDILYDYDSYRCCFREEDEVESFKSFILRNYSALIKKKSNIIQLALFESKDSIVYKIATHEVAKNCNKIYYDWCNKDERTLQEFLNDVKHSTDSTVPNIKHAAVNNGFSVIALAANIIKVYNLDGEYRQELRGHLKDINYCSLNYVGSSLITASEDKEVKIFKVADSLSTSGSFQGGNIKRSSLPSLEGSFEGKDDAELTFTEHDNPVLCCSYSPDEEFIISCDMEFVYVWKRSQQAWIIKHRKQSLKSAFHSCCFNNGGDMFAAATDHRIHMWDFVTGEEKASLDCEKFGVHRFCFAPDDAHLMSIFKDAVTEWDVKSGQQNLTISTGPNEDYVLCSIGVSERYIACGTTKGSVIIISQETKAVLKNLSAHNTDVISVAFSRDCRRLFSASSTAYILHDISEMKDSPTASFGVMSTCINEDLRVASSNQFLNCVEVRNGFEGNDVTSLPPETKENKITACALSNDCSIVVYGTRNGDVKVYNFATQSYITHKATPKHKGKINYILFSKIDATFFTCSEDNTIHIRRFGGDSLILKGHTESVLMCVEFQRSKKLLSCSKDGSLRVWDTENGELLLPIAEGHGNQDVRFCDISPDETQLASASTDETIKVWNSLHGTLQKTFRTKDKNSAVRCCRFSPFDKILISGHDNGKLILWHLIGSQPHRELTTHDSVVYDILFVDRSVQSNSNSAQFLSLSSGIKLWSSSAQLLQTILLPTSYRGVDPPCVWASNDFGVLVVVNNSVLYILKKY